MCRLRDLTYAAPILVEVLYWKGDRKVRCWAVGRAFSVAPKVRKTWKLACCQ